jgi:hypothetical protein
LPMSLFDQLVENALNNTRDLAPLKIVVENELLTNSTPINTHFHTKQS